MLTINQRRSPVAVAPQEPDDDYYVPVTSYWDECANSRAASDMLRHTVRLEQGLEWPCGHHRTPETTQVVGGVARCRVCRRQRWLRSFKIIAARKMARMAGLEAARRKLAERRSSITAAVIEGTYTRLPFDELCAGVAAIFDMTVDQLLGPSRTREMCRARSVLVRIMRERGASGPTVARLINRKDHSTVHYAFVTFPTYAREDERVMDAYTMLRDGAV